MNGKIIVLSGKSVLSCIFLIIVLFVFCVCGSNLVSNMIETSMTNRLLPIYSIETDKKEVAITFDCAWGADDISSIINTLVSNDIQATFFVVGSWVDKFPNAVKELNENNMEIANHSNSHSHINKMSYGEVLEDITKCNEKIEKLTGKKVKYYRGPYGEYNNTVISVAKELNMNVIQWDVDTLDYEGKTIDEMCSRIKKKIRNGSILLMHNDTEHTAEGLQKIIDTIQEEGYEIVPLDELIYHENYRINNEGRQLSI